MKEARGHGACCAAQLNSWNGNRKRRFCSAAWLRAAVCWAALSGGATAAIDHGSCSGMKGVALLTTGSPSGRLEYSLELGGSKASVACELASCADCSSV